MRRSRLLLLVLVASLAGLGAAYVPYRSYAAVWRRDVPKVPRCLIGARILLRKPALTSGDEPNFTSTGEMVYLTSVETKAVHCVGMVSKQLSGDLAQVLSEVDPERRGAELLRLARAIPPDAPHDEEATAAFYIGSGALAGLPPSPTLRAASDELDSLHACRFLTREPCAKRPPIPLLVWVLAVPSALGVLFVLGSLLLTGVSRLRDVLRARRARRAQGASGSTSSIKTPPVALG